MRLLDSLVRVRDRGTQGSREAAALQRETTIAINLAPGTPHYGMKGSPYEGSYTGLVASPQIFQGAAQMGATTEVHVQEYPALPAGQPPPALPTWLTDWQHLEGIVP